MLAFPESVAVADANAENDPSAFRLLAISVADVKAGTLTVALVPSTSTENSPGEASVPPDRDVAGVTAAKPLGL